MDYNASNLLDLNMIEKKSHNMVEIKIKVFTIEKKILSLDAYFHSEVIKTHNFIKKRMNRTHISHFLNV